LSTSDANAPAGPMSRREIRGILFGVLLAMFLAALDQTIVAPALPTIARDLGQFNAISWVVTAYLLSATAATPILGKLSDLYGRRRLLMAGVGIFVLGSVACALAPGMVGLIVARTVQGAGGGALISLANTVIADVVSPRERGRYQGYIAGAYTLASIAGPVLGGYFAQYLSWTLIFWINVPLGLLAIHMSNRALKRLPVKGTSHRIDYLGSGLMAAATVCFLLALTWGGHRFAWASPAILGLFLLVAMLAFLFVWRQRVALEPVLPLSLLANPVVRMAALVGLLVVMINISTGVYVPLFLQLDRGMTADASGLVLIAPMVGIVAGALAAGQYMRFVGRYKMPPVLGTVAAAASLWTLGRGVESLSLDAIVALLGVVGLGLGSAMPPMLVATQNAVNPRDLGIATASHTFFRSLGGAVGVALFGAIILGIMHGHLAGLATGAPADLDQVLRQGAASPAAMPDLHRAFAVFFETAAVLTLAATGGLLALRELPLREHPASAAPVDVPAE
jgi:EmrB/QacA subfamily drug resistance transporter